MTKYPKFIRFEDFRQIKNLDDTLKLLGIDYLKCRALTGLDPNFFQPHWCVVYKGNLKSKHNRQKIKMFRTRYWSGCFL